MGLKSRIFPALLIIAAVLLYAFYPTDRKRIKMVIEKSAVAIMQENIDQLMEHISFNYKDLYGGNYLILRKRMEQTFKRYDDLEISAEVMKVTVKEDQAVAGLKMSVIGSEGSGRGYVIGSAEGDEEIDVYMEKSPYEWKVTKVEMGASNN